MQRFKVNISPGVSQVVEAENSVEARQKVKAQIAKGAMSPFYDKLYFDYDTGVNVKGLRSSLGRAETDKEKDLVLKNLFESIKGAEEAEDQDAVLENKVGNDGFVRNTRGQIALTPSGLEELGLPIQQKKLADGSVINLNTVIDEKAWFTSGDFADFAGIAGPIAGALTFLSPQLKVIKGLRALFGGNKVMSNMFASGVGSAAGKAAEEEIFDTQQGFQLQDRDDLNSLYATEFFLGSVGQGIGEAVGGAFGLLFGRKAPTSDVRLIRQGNKGRIVTDVMKLDRDIGREATEKEIKRAIKDGKVGMLDYKFVPSQTTLKKQLPGKAQQIGEQVLGPARANEGNSYLFGNLNHLLKAIDAHDASLNKYISDATKGSLDEQIQAARSKLDMEELNVSKVLNDFLKDLQEDSFNAGDLTRTPGTEEVGENIIKVLKSARSQVTRVLGKEYDNVDNQFYDLINVPANATKAQKDTAFAISRTIGLTQERYLKDSINVLEQFKASNSAWEVAGATDPGLPGGVIKQIENALEKMLAQAQKGTLSLTNVRNSYDSIKDMASSSMVPTQLRRQVLRILNKLDDRRHVELDEAGKNFIEGKGLGSTDSIFTTLEINSPEEFSRVLAETQKRLDIGDGFGIQPAEQRLITKAVGDLRDANKLSAKLLEPFDRIRINKTIERGGTGSYNADEVYINLVENGKPKDLKDLFQSLRTYDQYKRQMAAGGKGTATTAEQDLKAALRKRLFTDAGRMSTDTSGAEAVIDFTAFARHIQKFEGRHEGKLLELFSDAGGGRSTGKNVLDTINQLVKLKPSLKPADLKDLINSFTTSGKGLAASDSGISFIQGLTQLAKASEAKLIFTSNTAISELPLKGVDETVKAIFRPNAGSNIRILKEAVSDEVFKEVQQASMQRLLSKSIDFNYNGKGNITEVFKAGHLKSALTTYGDETLEAMFGKEVTLGLKDFQRYIDLSTVGELGRGGSAGGLVAAGIAAGIVFAPLATLPTLAGLAVMRQLLANPRFVGIMLKTDKGSIKQAIEMARRAAGIVGVRYVNGQAELIGFETNKALNEATNQAEDKGMIDTAKDFFKSTTEQAGQIRNEIPQSFPISQSNIPVPDVQPVQMPNLNPLSPDRVDFDEQLFGRPSRIG